MIMAENLDDRQVEEREGSHSSLIPQHIERPATPRKLIQTARILLPDFILGEALVYSPVFFPFNTSKALFQIKRG